MLEDLLLLGGVEGEFSDMIRGRKFLALREMVVVVEENVDACITRDVGKIGAVFSKNYKHQTFPESMGLSEETKEEYIKRCEGLLPSFTGFEVRTQPRVTALRLAD